MSDHPVRREHVRAAIWPRPPVEGPKGPVHRYVIVGIVATDRPIAAFHNPDGSIRNELVLDGAAPGLADILDHVRATVPDRPLGDAVDVLLNLETIGEAGIIDGNPGNPHREGDARGIIIGGPGNPHKPGA